MLQNDLDYFMQWNKTWQGSLNIPKSKYPSLGSSDGSPSGDSYTLLQLTLTTWRFRNIVRNKT